MINPTEDQYKYLENLINYNNSFRAVPWSLDDWIDIYFKGSWDIYRASKLIIKLKEENQNKLIKFSEKVNTTSIKKRNQIFASDFNSYNFCPNSFYLKYHGFVNRNLYELDSGAFYHGEMTNEDNNGHSNQNNKILRKFIPEIKNIKWLKFNKNDLLHNSNFNLFGIPDGILQFNNNQLAVIELKTTNNSHLEKAFQGDIMQICAYYNLCKYSGKISPQRISNIMYLIYVSKLNNDRTLFQIDYCDYQNFFIQNLNKLQNILFNKDIFLSEKYFNKCNSCGYRFLCQKKSVTS